MSIVAVQIGQCGNQIGGQFYNKLLQDVQSKKPHVSPKANQEYIEDVKQRFFVESPSKDRQSNVLDARAVMVDMEPKVIAQTCQLARRTGLWKYPTGQQFCQQRGAGNNWANGFCFYGPRAKEAVMDMVQREAEKCDHLGGFLCLMSVAGGTGSGVGAYLTRCLRDSFPHAFILNQVVWPYRTGEVIVQNYNALLTMASLYRTSDAVLLLNNDHLQEICTRRLHIKQVTLEDMNGVIADKLSSALLPVYQATSSNSHSIVHNCLGEMLKQVTPHSEYKLLNIRKIPQVSKQVVAYNSDTWSGLLKHLRQMQLADSATDEGINWSMSLEDPATLRGGVRHNRSMASLLILRGQDAASADVASFRDARLYAPWMTSHLTLTRWYQPRAFCHYEKSAVLISNSRSSAAPLEHVVRRAWDMFSAKAFFHQYCSYGLTDSDFLDSFACLEQVISNYTDL